MEEASTENRAKEFELIYEKIYHMHGLIDAIGSQIINMKAAKPMHRTIAMQMGHYPETNTVEDQAETLAMLQSGELKIA